MNGRACALRPGGAGALACGLEPDQALPQAARPVPNGLRPLLDDEQVDMRRIRESHAVFRPVRSFLEHHGIHAKYFQIEGAAATVILDEAERWNADLVVMGSRGHGALGQPVLGSAVSQVLARATLPLLVVPPAHARS